MNVIMKGLYEYRKRVSLTSKGTNINIMVYVVLKAKLGCHILL